jgi:hypothetical protein
MTTNIDFLEELATRCSRLLGSQAVQKSSVRRIYRPDDMLRILESFEEIRNDSQKSWDPYNDHLCQIIEHNLELFLIVITSYRRQHYINLLSASIPYSKTLNTSYICGSGIKKLIELLSSVSEVNGKIIFGLLGPVLGLPQDLLSGICLMI